MEFDFICPNKEAAVNLDMALEDYESIIQQNTDNQWEVSGKTHPTKINKQILTQWLSFMVDLGCKHNCMFEGFGALMPD